MTAPADPGRARAGRWQVVLLFLVFALPMLAAWVIYSLGEGVLPEGSVAAGDLVEPARPAPATALVTREGTPAELPELVRDQWTLVLHAPAGCDAACRERLEVMRSTRLALGEDLHRAASLLVLGPEAESPELPAEGGPTVARLADTEAARRFAAWRSGGGADPGAWRIDLVDPLGNLMMTYPHGEDPKAILRDLRRLLKASRIG